MSRNIQLVTLLRHIKAKKISVTAASKLTIAFPIYSMLWNAVHGKHTGTMGGQTRLSLESELVIVNVKETMTK